MIQLKKIQAWEARHEAGLISGFQDVLMEKMMTDSWQKKFKKKKKKGISMGTLGRRGRRSRQQLQQDLTRSGQQLRRQKRNFSGYQIGQ